jgi:hypothetical protein
MGGAAESRPVSHVAAGDLRSAFGGESDKHVTWRKRASRSPGILAARARMGMETKASRLCFVPSPRRLALAQKDSSPLDYRYIVLLLLYTVCWWSACSNFFSSLFDSIMRRRLMMMHVQG